jgi:acylphosphatase
VGFRATTADEARALALHGWVRNRHDGSVEVVAEGSEASLTRLLDFLRTGPRMANVTQVTVDWSAATGESAPFAVKSTA